LFNKDEYNPSIPAVTKQIKQIEKTGEFVVHPPNSVGLPVGSGEKQKGFTPPKLEPFLDLRIHQPAPMPQKQQQPPLYLPSYQHLYQPPGTFIGATQILPIINNMKIESKGMFDNHENMMTIYEDALPPKLFGASYETLEERINLNEYVRNILTRQDNNPLNNLRQFVHKFKFLDLNPYNCNLFSNNPYFDLPKDMLLYRTCYPVTYNHKSGQAMCARNSTSINLRIYKFSNEDIAKHLPQHFDIAIKQLPVTARYRERMTTAAVAMPVALVAPDDNQQNIKNSELWREITLYCFIRDNILKPKICPNFTMIYTYNIIASSFINFHKLAMKKGHRLPPTHFSIANHSLICVTESQTNNLINWTSSAYEKTNNVSKMIYTGFYTEKVWLSIYFQIVVAFHIMQKYKFIYKDFDLKNNIYVKEVPTDSVNIKYWKYIIDNYEFYVPNHGFVVLIDSKYKDLDNPMIDRMQHKLYAECCDDPDDRIFEEIRDAFVRTISRSVFGESFVKNGGNKPPESILRLIDEINMSVVDPARELLLQQRLRNARLRPIVPPPPAVAPAVATINFTRILVRHFTMFLNNRIGTKLKNAEKIYVNKNDDKNFKTGSIVVYEYIHDNYKFVLFDSSIDDNLNCIIYTRDDSDHGLQKCKQRSVPIGNLHSFEAYEIIVQENKIGGTNFAESNLLETYVA